jgi:transposase-like protein
MEAIDDRKYASKAARRYDAEFKENAVALVSSGRSITQVARDLGCSTWSLGRWVRRQQANQKQTQPQTLAGETAQQRELRRLRQEIDYLRRQRDILKKALSIVSTEHPEGGLR